MKVNEILAESVAKPKFNGEFPNAFKAVGKSPANSRYIKWMEADIPTIKACIDAGEIINTQFSSIKDHVNAFVRQVYESSTNWDELRNARGEETNSELFSELYGAISVWDLRGLVSSKKKLAKVSKEAKATGIYRNFMEMADELQPLVDAMEYLKSVTVKASAKKAEAKAAQAAEEGEYKKKYTDHKDVKKVVAILKKVSADVEHDLYESNLKYMKQKVEVFKKAAEAGDSDYTEIFKRDGFGRLIMQSICERMSTPKGESARKKYFKLIDKWEAKIEDMAKKSAADVVDKFVYKNSGKLSFIIYTKNNLEKVTLKNVTVSRGAVEAVLHLEFADGSEFIADSSVVLAYSVLGKPFYRYPTVFKNVKLPDGSKMGQPSEQRMDEVFAITK